MQQNPEPAASAIQVNPDQKENFVPTDGTRLPIDRSGDFGASPFLRQLSGKQRLTRAYSLHSFGTNAHDRFRSIAPWLPRATSSTTFRRRADVHRTHSCGALAGLGLVTRYAAARIPLCLQGPS
jgi:hypothetical protein